MFYYIKRSNFIAPILELKNVNKTTFYTTNTFILQMSKKYQIYYLFMFREEIALFPSLSLLTNDAYTYFWVQTNYINSLYRGLRCVSLIFFGKLTSQSCYIGVDLYSFGTTGTPCTRPTKPNLLTRFLHNTYQALSAIYQNLSFHENSMTALP